MRFSCDAPFVYFLRSCIVLHYESLSDLRVSLAHSCNSRKHPAHVQLVSLPVENRSSDLGINPHVQQEDSIFVSHFRHFVGLQILDVKIIGIEVHLIAGLRHFAGR